MEEVEDKQPMHHVVPPDFLSVMLCRRIKKLKRPGWEQRRMQRRILRANAATLRILAGDTADQEDSSSDEDSEIEGGDGDDCHGLRQRLEAVYEHVVSALSMLRLPLA